MGMFSFATCASRPFFLQSAKHYLKTWTRIRCLPDIESFSDMPRKYVLYNGSVPVSEDYMISKQ